MNTPSERALPSQKLRDRVCEADIIRKTVVTVLCFFFVSCAQEAPEKPVFEKTVNPYQGASSKSGLSTSGIDDGDLQSLPVDELPITNAGFRAEGELIYNQRCASCHQPIPISNRKGVDAGKILNDYTKNFPTHRNIEWPIDEEAFMIEAALSPLAL